MKNYLITGGAGFIGSHLLDKLINSSNIICVDNFDEYYSPKIKKNNIKDHLNKKNFKLYKTDITDQDKLKSIFEENKIDCIINLAARVGVRASAAETKSYISTNINGTVNLLEFAREYNIKKFIQASSSSVYGEVKDFSINEEAKINKPISIYAATKTAVEQICYTYSYLYNINTICLRFFTVYGPRQRPDMAIHKFSKLISDNKPINVYGNGTTKRDYTYIDDIIQGILACIEYDKSPYEIFNLGFSNTVELKYLIELIESNIGKKAIIKNLAMQDGDVTVTHSDISKAKKLLKYSPQVPIEEGLKKFIKWFCDENK